MGLVFYCLELVSGMNYVEQDVHFTSEVHIKYTSDDLLNF